MTTAKKLMTAEEFFDLPDDGRRLELLDGLVVELPHPHTHQANAHRGEFALTPGLVRRVAQPCARLAQATTSQGV